MSKSDSPPDLSEEQLDEIAQRVLDEMEVDEEMPEGEAAKAHRRDVLKTLGALGTGAAVGGAGYAASTGGARAGSNQVGAVGSSGNPIDVVAEDIYGPGGQGSGDAVGFEAANVDQETNKTDILRITNSDGLVRETDLATAISNLPAAGGEVNLPQAVASVASTLTLPGGDGTVTKLTGRGAPHENETAGSVIDSTITNGNNVIETGGGSNARGNILRDFAVDCSGSDGRGINASNLYQNGELRNVAVYGAGDAGFYLGGCWTMEFSRLRSKKCGGDGVTMVNCNGTDITTVHAQSNGRYGIYLLNAQGGAVTSCNTEDNSATGLRVGNGCLGTTVRGHYSEGDNRGITVKGDAVTIDGAYIKDTTDVGIRCDGASNVSIQGVDFTGTGGSELQFVDTDGAVVSGCNAEDGTLNVAISGTTTDIDILDEPTWNGGRGASTGSSGDASVTFDAPFSAKPAVSLSSASAFQGRVTGFGTDANGNYDSMSVSFTDESGADPGSSINFSWNASVS